MQRLQLLYDSEINFKFSSFHPRGIDWSLGDGLTHAIVSGRTGTVEQALDELCDAACAHFPDSVFAKGT